MSDHELPLDSTGYVRFTSSELPRVRVCPSSKVESLHKPDVSDDPTKFGIAYHEAMAEAARYGRHNVPLEEIAGHYDANERELVSVFNRFDYDPLGGEAEVDIEVRFDDIKAVIRGRLDIAKESEEDQEVIDVTDYKTTKRAEQDPEPWADPQTQSYGVGVFESMNPRAVRLFKAYPRYGESGWSAAFEIDDSNVAAVRGRLQDVMSRAIKEATKPAGERRYTLSHFCDYCPGRLTCPGITHAFAQAANATRDVAVLKKNGQPGKRTKFEVEIPITYDNVPNLIELAKLMKKTGEAISKEVKAFVQSVGPIPIPNDDGKYVAVIPKGRSAALNDSNLLAAARALGGEESEVMDRINAVADAINYVKFSMPRSVADTLDIYDESTLEEKLP